MQLLQVTDVEDVDIDLGIAFVQCQIYQPLMELQGVHHSTMTREDLNLNLMQDQIPSLIIMVAAIAVSARENLSVLVPCITG